MKKILQFRYLYLALLFLAGYTSYAQIPSNVYHSELEKDGRVIKHELKLTGNYIIHTMYEENPAKFIKTLGGFFKVEGNHLNVQLEFNSNFAKDSVRQLIIPFKINGSNLILELNSKLEFKPIEERSQDLDGQWLFGTRGPDKGQERRGDSKPRKTLKFLQNGKFQWIAYHTETMKFSGTGGGSFTSKDGVYQENIEYFSRDNSRVGAQLKFDFEVKENDWHHQGNNSKGEPMYEIWMRRSSK
ncbi:hypothetical protein [Maribacter sp. HTCC2170]|uniref:hypothetical protein n=1 Tax=Maribacter sp. (strain HTCC2170 / KCCM 42371) TaxID=313603 RepID=UPI00006BD4A4|nr:hypothetical protein [Maribacter sp. HTCC2170]EAR02512.1 hypothetical protein FB2170_04475 [Maribacter sp. HTCC2170]